jgi:hypothetical protein
MTGMLKSISLGAILGSLFGLGCYFCCIPCFHSNDDRHGFVRGVGLGSVLAGGLIIGLGVPLSLRDTVLIPAYVWFIVGGIIMAIGFTMAAVGHKSQKFVIGNTTAADADATTKV